jgi:thiamine biosynthesis lipoprotein
MKRAAFFHLVLGLAVLVALLLAGAVRTDREYHETLYVFGTLVEIVIDGEDEVRARAATARIGRAFQTFHDDWHAWRPGMLNNLNAAIAAGESYSVDDALATVLRQGRDLSCASGGLFEPAIGGLIELWGFHADTPPTGAPPSAAAVERLRGARPRMAALRFDGTRISSVNPAVQLDLGGFAKGAALDLAAAQLQADGIRNAVLNAGGDVNVIGTHGPRVWRVAIRDPFAWGAVAAISLRPGEVLYTSGNYERYFEHDGQRFSHILDPRTGAPVREIVSVSVLDTNGGRADAAATALSVAGRDSWARVATQMGISAALLIADDGAAYATPAMRDRLEPVGARLSDLHVVPLAPAQGTPDTDCVVD